MWLLISSSVLPILANYNAKVYKLVDLFVVFLGYMLFVVDFHDFCLGFVYLDSGLLGFLVDSIELFVGILVFWGQESDVIGEIQVLQLLG
jgi:hypothetical protein